MPVDSYLLGTRLSCEESPSRTDEDGRKFRQVVADGNRLSEIEALELRAFAAQIATRAVNEQHTYEPPFPVSHYIRTTWFIERCLRLPNLL